MERFLCQVLKRVTPTLSERKKEKRVVAEVRARISGLIAKSGHRIEPMLVGSLAKGTDLSKNKDIDFFLLFEHKVQREELERIALSIGKTFFKSAGGKYEISYAEHPYVRGVYRGYDLEIVPCYRIGHHDKVISAVDRSPLHTKYVIDKLRNRKKLIGEILLLKQFLKANNIYGADAAVEGFSGYLCELLILRYRSFARVLKNSSKWKAGTMIKISGSKDPTKSFDEPLVFIDPVDNKRNVAAAVSFGSMAQFVELSKRFLQKPSRSFFDAKPRRQMRREAFPRLLKSRGTRIVVLKTPKPDLVPDTLIPQVKKTLRSIEKTAHSHGFQTENLDYAMGRNLYLVFEFSVFRLPEVELRIGPSINAKDGDQRGFVEKNRAAAFSEPRIENGRWVAEVRRKYTHVDALIRDILKDPESFGKQLRTRRFSVLEGGGLLKIDEPEFWKKMNELW